MSKIRIVKIRIRPEQTKRGRLRRMERKKDPTGSQRLRETIDAAIAKSHSYDEFLSIMKKNYLKASPLGCMDNLRQNDWFGFFGETAFLPAPVPNQPPVPIANSD